MIGRTMLLVGALLSLPAGAEEDAAALLAPFAAEPSVEQLQRAAIRHALLEPERVRSWESRLRYAPLAPSLRFRVGRGLNELQRTTGADGSTRLTVGNHDTWTFELSASWALDRLVFSPEELRLGREAQRVAARRERLLAEVAALYHERRRLQVELAHSPPEDPRELVEARLQLEELSATLEGLTGGALRRARREGPREPP